MTSNDLIFSAPFIILSLGALLVIILDVFQDGKSPSGTVTGLILALASVVSLMLPCLHCSTTTIFGGLWVVDTLSATMTFIILLASLLSVILGLGKISSEGIEAKGEYYSLLLMSTAGAIVFISANELITLFVGLEIMSMALYCLCASAIGSRRGSESALKYFLLGSFSSAFLLYGIALLYGMTGTTFIEPMADNLVHVNSNVTLFGMGLVLVGLVFKIGAVPFHFWVPDVYEGAPTTITAYMATVIKASAFIAALRLLWIGFEHLYVFWSGAVWAMAVVTMTWGNLVALRQRSLKRMLAFSSIAHAGYMMVGFLAPGKEFGGGGAIIYYLVAYTVMTLGAFGVVLATSSHRSKEPHSDDVSHFHGLGFTHPFLGVLMALFMLSLAGIPPGFAGLVGKFYIFNAAVKAEYIGLVVIGMINSAISCYYYLRVVVAMYFIEPAKEEGNSIPELDFSLGGSLVLCAIGVVVLGLFPGFVMR